MAFTDRRPEPNRTAKVIAVATFQAAMAYALVTGLAVEFEERPVLLFTARDYPTEDKQVPPPPKPDEKPRVIEKPLDAPPPDPGPFALDRHTVIEFPLDPVPLPPLGGSLTRLPPEPDFPPVAPFPRNDPAGWVTTNDYPTRDIRDGNEGTARFLLSIDAGGKVLGCEIVGSSGHAGLDAATCKYVSQRARFDAGRDTTGERVAGTYKGAVRWIIPGY